MRVRRGERGFTMVEMLVTLAVAVIGMTGVLALNLATMRSNANASATADAIAIAQKTLEDSRSKTLTQMLTDYGGGAALPIDYDFGNTTELGRTTTYYKRILVEQLGAGDLLRVRVEISWGEDGAPIDDDAHRHVIALELVRTRQETL